MHEVLRCLAHVSDDLAQVSRIVDEECSKLLLILVVGDGPRQMWHTA